MSLDQSSSQRSYVFDYSDADTEVIDVEEPPRILRSRVATGDLAVHVRLFDFVDGARDGWHKLAPNGYETACGIEFGMRDEAERRMERLLEHPLNVNCDCWTAHEREKADEKHLHDFGVPFTPRKRKP